MVLKGGFFYRYHYNSCLSEICHYNSCIRNAAITIFTFFEICHCVRQTNVWARLQAYVAYDRSYPSVSRLHVNGAVTIAVSVVLTLPVSPQSAPTKNPKPATPTAVDRRSGPRRRRKGVQMSSSSIAAGSKRGRYPLLDCPNCHVPLIRILSKQEHSMNESFVKCPNNVKARISSIH
jgi:hypothetical protein